VADMTPADLVRCIDFRYLTDCITPDWALEFLTEKARTKAARVTSCRPKATPATPPLPVGSAMTTPSSGGSAAKQWTLASAISR